MSDHDAVIGLSVTVTFLLVCLCCVVAYYNRILMERNRCRYVTVNDLENPLLPPEDEGL